MVASRQEVTSLASSLPDMERAQLSLTLPGLEAAACDHLSRRRFCFDGLCEQNGVGVWLKSVRRRTAPAARTGLFSNITPRSGQPQAQDAFLIGGARQPLMRTVYESQYGIGGRAIISQKITSTAANAGNPKANHHRKVGNTGRAAWRWSLPHRRQDRAFASASTPPVASRRRSPGTVRWTPQSTHRGGNIRSTKRAMCR